MSKQVNTSNAGDSTADDKILPIVDQCFIITPIGEVNSEVYIKAMGLIEAVIEPVLKEFKFKAVAANHISSPGSINKQLIKSILEDKLVIANLTGLNPNVMYELAVRHAVRLPVVIMAEKGTRLPFDITDQRTIFYDDSLAGLNIAREQLRSMIEVALKEEEPDNPIYQAAEQALIFKSLKADDPIKLVMERLDRMESRISTSRTEVNLSKSDYGRHIVYGTFVDGSFESNRDAFIYIRKIADLYPGVKLNSLAQSNPVRLLFYCEPEADFDGFVSRLRIDSNFKVEQVVS